MKWIILNMKLEKTYKTQSDLFKDFWELKCILFEKYTDLELVLKKKFKNGLPKKLYSAYGQYGESCIENMLKPGFNLYNYDEIRLRFIYDNSTEHMYELTINFGNGNVELQLDDGKKLIYINDVNLKKLEKYISNLAKLRKTNSKEPCSSGCRYKHEYEMLGRCRFLKPSLADS